MIFNKHIKKKAFEGLKRVNKKYQNEADKLTKRAIDLHTLRLESSEDLIKKSEKFISTLANRPKEFEKSINEFKYSFQAFENTIQEIENGDNVNKTVRNSYSILSEKRNALKMARRGNHTNVVDYLINKGAK